MKHTIAILCIAIALHISGCKKERTAMAPLATIDLGYSIRVNDIKMLSDTAWIVCGGNRNVEGYIFKSKNKGESWSVYPSEFAKSIYCLEFSTAQYGFAGGDFLHLWHTLDYGETWNFYWLADQVPFNGEDRPAVREIKMKTAVDWYFCGGENMGEGVVYETHNAGTNWNFKFVQHEMRSLQMNNEAKALVVGHGAAYTFDFTLDSFEKNNFQNDFITSTTCIDDERCLAVSYNGAIYESENFGTTWLEQEASNKLFGTRINWNKIAHNGSTVVVAGNEGYFAQSTDGGQNWQLFQLDNQPNLYSLAISNNQVWATSDGGKIYRLI